MKISLISLDLLQNLMFPFFKIGTLRRLNRNEAAVIAWKLFEPLEGGYQSGHYNMIGAFGSRATQNAVLAIHGLYVTVMVLYAIFNNK